MRLARSIPGCVSGFGSRIVRNDVCLFASFLFFFLRCLLALGREEGGGGGGGGGGGAAAAGSMNTIDSVCVLESTSVVVLCLSI